MVNLWTNKNYNILEWTLIVLKFNNPVIPKNKIELLSTKESLVRQWVSILNDKIKHWCAISNKMHALPRKFADQIFT